MTVAAAWTLGLWLKQLWVQKVNAMDKEPPSYVVGTAESGWRVGGWRGQTMKFAGLFS